MEFVRLLILLGKYVLTKIQNQEYTYICVYTSSSLHLYVVILVARFFFRVLINYNWCIILLKYMLLVYYRNSNYYRGIGTYNGKYIYKNSLIYLITMKLLKVWLLRWRMGKRTTVVKAGSTLTLQWLFISRINNALPQYYSCNGLLYTYPFSGCSYPGVTTVTTVTTVTAAPVGQFQPLPASNGGQFSTTLARNYSSSIIVSLRNRQSMNSTNR